IAVDLRVGEPPHQPAQLTGDVGAVGDPHVAFGANLDAVRLQRGPRCIDLVVVEEHVKDAHATAGEAADALDVDVGAPEGGTDAGDDSRSVLDLNHEVGLNGHHTPCLLVHQTLRGPTRNQS